MPTRGQTYKRLLLLLLPSLLFAELTEIHYRSGPRKKAIFLDSSECEIKVQSGSAKIKIAKEKIDCIVLPAGDTIHYADFSCPEPVLPVKKAETPETKPTAPVQEKETVYLNVNGKLVPEEHLQKNCALPEIHLSSKSQTYWNYGGTHGVPFSTTEVKHYFSVENGPQNIRIRGMGSSLTEYVQTVPEAAEKMSSYRASKITAYTMMAAGIGITVGGFIGATQQGGEEMPSLGIPIMGISLAAGSWIPFLMSKKQMTQAVNTYNAQRCFQ